MHTLRPLTYFLCKKLSIFLVYFPLLICFSLVQAQPEVYHELSELPRLKQSRFVYDNTGKIQPAELKALQSSVSALESDTGAEIGIVFLQKLPTGISAKEAATFIFNDQKLGKQGEDNGILILAVMNQRRWEIETGYGMEGVFPDALCRRMGESFLVPKFKENKYADGLLQLVKFISEVYRAEVQRQTLAPETDTQLQNLKQEAKWEDTKNYVKELIPVFAGILILLFGSLHWFVANKNYKIEKEKYYLSRGYYHKKTKPVFWASIWALIAGSILVFYFFNIWWALIFLNIAVSTHYMLRRLQRDSLLRNRFIYNNDKRNEVLRDQVFSPYKIAIFLPFPTIFYAIYNHWKSNQLYWDRNYNCPKCSSKLNRVKISEWQEKSHPH
ncbi:MAG: TPM domain-containing protein, partial [Leptospiraceae bacterium]|nr:TPM domain-containing protein [Leptospiraceae bacterium]